MSETCSDQVNNAFASVMILSLKVWVPFTVRVEVTFPLS